VNELLRYGTTIYDANCLVYYIFRFDERDAAGKLVTISGPHTEHARRITEALIASNKTVCTLFAAWLEAEKVAVVTALKQALQEGYIQTALGIVQGRPSAMLELRLAHALRAQLSRLKQEMWFSIDKRFVAAPQRLAALQHLYDKFKLDPEKQKLIPPYKGDPSKVDGALVLFSGAVRLPLLTNDRELYHFAEDLRTSGFCELIKGFPQVRFD
jgi:hypothetical protein